MADDDRRCVLLLFHFPFCLSLPSPHDALRNLGRRDTISSSHVSRRKLRVELYIEGVTNAVGIDHPVSLRWKVSDIESVSRAPLECAGEFLGLRL